MAKIPVTLPTSPIGTTNPAAQPPSASGVVPMASAPSRGPVQSREHFSDRDEPKSWARALNRLQTAIRQALAIVKAVPFLAQGGILTTGVSFGAGSNTVVQHGLGRPYAGYMVINVKTTYGSFYDVGNFVGGQPAPSLNAQQITLVSLNRCTGDVWVY